MKFYRRIDVVWFKAILMKVVQQKLKMINSFTLRESYVRGSKKSFQKILEIKWKGTFSFSPAGICGTTFQGGPL